MKKSIKILIIVGIILAVIIGAICIGVSKLNKEKTPVKAEEFRTTMESNGFKVVDVTSQFAQYNGYMNTAYVAQKDEYQIEFFVLSSLDNAVSMYNTNKAKFESQKANASGSYETSIKNYSVYSITTNGKYKYVSRIDDTLIYIDADTTYQGDIKAIVKKLGY